MLLNGMSMVEKLEEITVTDESVVLAMAPSMVDGQEQRIATV